MFELTQVDLIHTGPRKKFYKIACFFDEENKIYAVIKSWGKEFSMGKAKLETYQSFNGMISAAEKMETQKRTRRDTDGHYYAVDDSYSKLEVKAFFSMDQIADYRDCTTDSTREKMSYVAHKFLPETIEGEITFDELFEEEKPRPLPFSEYENAGAWA